MKNHLRLLSALLLSLYLNQAHAVEPLKVSDAWARASAPGQQVGAAYMTLESAYDLVVAKVESPMAGSVEIHKMSMKDGIMRMRMMESLPLTAGHPFKLEPGGFHLMLFDLKEPLKAGATVPFNLQLKDSQGRLTTLEISLPVKTSNN